ncbi:MAG: asparagine synthase (glutamine-hydrolyzing) [Candidatus Omnitrophota bacterium]
MCGIVGRIEKSGRKVDEQILIRMARSLRHRGPDEEGFYFNGDIGLGHRRLAIIDLTTGRQPLKNETGKIILVANGEIYNFQQIRHELKKRGHLFQTKSDNEVIVHLYEEKGVDCLQDLRGMFAFGLWDEDKKRLFLSRDRLGKKPLVYAETSSAFTFASEIRTLLIAPDVTKEIDPEALNTFLTLQYIPSPQSIFTGIKKIPAGHYLIYQHGEIKIERYWSPDFNHKLRISEEEAQRLLSETLKEAVRLRMISDVPLGAFLSGGIDSSAVVALMSHLSKKPVKTFSIGFSERNYDELKYARKVAKTFHTDHAEFVVKPDVISILPRIVEHYGEPFGDSSAIPTFYLCGETRKYVTVALSGDGGDENFAGYPRYRQALFLEKILDFRPRLLKTISGASLYRRYGSLRKIEWALRDAPSLTPARRYSRWLTVFPESEKESLYQPFFKQGLLSDPLYQVEKDWKEAKDLLEKMLLVDFKTYLPDCLQVKMDIASMAHGLEIRSPFLDHKLVELIASLPAGYKIRYTRSKYLLRKSLKGMLPEEVLKRKKKGFGIPLAVWFRKDLQGYLTSFILGEKALKRGYFNPEHIRKILGEHLSGRVDHANRLYLLLVLEMWHQMYID